MDEFVFKINGTDRKFISTTYALEKALKDLGVENVSDLAGLFKFNTIIPTVRTFMFHSAVWACKKERKEVDFDETDVYAWIDETGGTKGEFYNRFTSYLIESLGFKGEMEEQDEEETVKKKKSNGGTSKP